MTTPIPSEEVGATIYQMLVEAVEQEFAGESEAAKQEALFCILSAVA